MLEEVPSANGLEIKVGLGMLSSDLPSSLGGPLARTASEIIAADEGCPEACVGNVAFALVNSYDVDRDGVISDAEALDTEVVGAAFAPDMDVTTAGADGPVFWPGADRIKEHVSLAIRLSAVRYTPSTGSRSTAP